ncbi:hypothetical protein OSB04_009121 [Centaurea solstitialis]|uniref:Uncharacterized protein n=1 Tax=Centaurea solstitialis TaxID=347529 RepID=A0AA38WU90_9ASTR|nr:hypothetical protein OSB04_009121 [Centaurea solstitialis]
MQSPSPSQSKVEVIKQAIKQLMEEEMDDSGDDNHHHSLLSKLMSQIFTVLSHQQLLRASPTTLLKFSQYFLTSSSNSFFLFFPYQQLEKLEAEPEAYADSKLGNPTVSEVSMIMKLKDRVSHPFRSVSGLFKGIIKPPKANGNEEESHSPITSITSDLIESSPVHDLRIPELPKIDLGFQDEE